MNDFHKPALFAGHEFTAFRGGEDPAEVSYLAPRSARALLARGPVEPQPDLVDRVVAFADENGIDVLAELWSSSSAHSLPGALWRLYLIRDMIVANAEHTSIVYGRGVEISVTPDALVAGAPVPAGPGEMRALADRILRGAFVGDFADALHRAAAFGRVLAPGCTSMAVDAEFTNPGGAGGGAGGPRGAFGGGPGWGGVGTPCTAPPCSGAFGPRAPLPWPLTLNSTPPGGPRRGPRKPFG